jgi:opacity protein-like surface antigen
MKKLSILLVFFVVCGLIANASAADFGLYSVGARGGILLPEDPWDTGFFIGGTANIGELTDNLELHPILTYWSTGYSFEGVDLDLSLSNIQVGGDVHYYLENVEGLYVGGGISLNFVSAEFATVNFFTGESITESSSDTDFGFDILGGYEIPFGDNTGFIEARYNIISDLNTFEIGVGILFNLEN